MFRRKVMVLPKVKLLARTIIHGKLNIFYMLHRKRTFLLCPQWSVPCAKNERSIFHSSSEWCFDNEVAEVCWVLGDSLPTSIYN